MDVPFFSDYIPLSPQMEAWVITLINDQLDVMEDEITYDESAVSRIAQEMNEIAKPTEQVVIFHGTLALPSDMKES